MKSKPHIYLIIERPDGLYSKAQVDGDKITRSMFDAAEDLLHTLTTGERPFIKNAYDLVARAFNTTREDAKQRILAASFGMATLKIEGQSRVSPQDRRRIADGDRALALPDPQCPDEAQAQLKIIHDGICALQSLDDIGEEGNLLAHENLRTLQERCKALESRLASKKR
jgi:hypothetical protein